MKVRYHDAVASLSERLGTDRWFLGSRYDVSFFPSPVLRVWHRLWPVLLFTRSPTQPQPIRNKTNHSIPFSIFPRFRFHFPIPKPTAPQQPSTPSHSPTSTPSYTRTTTCASKSLSALISSLGSGGCMRLLGGLLWRVRGGGS